jgi:hypothetical protein
MVSTSIGINRGTFPGGSFLSRFFLGVKFLGACCVGDGIYLGGGCCVGNGFPGGSFPGGSFLGGSIHDCN